jgi:hypothetical protein
MEISYLPRGAGRRGVVVLGDRGGQHLTGYA